MEPGIAGEQAARAGAVEIVQRRSAEGRAVGNPAACVRGERAAEREVPGVVSAEAAVVIVPAGDLQVLRTELGLPERKGGAIGLIAVVNRGAARDVDILPGIADITQTRRQQAGAEHNIILPVGHPAPGLKAGCANRNRVELVIGRSDAKSVRPRGRYGLRQPRVHAAVDQVAATDVEVGVAATLPAANFQACLTPQRGFHSGGNALLAHGIVVRIEREAAFILRGEALRRALVAGYEHASRSRVAPSRLNLSGPMAARR